MITNTTAFTSLYLSEKPLVAKKKKAARYRVYKKNISLYPFIEASPSNVKNLIVVDVDDDEFEWKLKSAVWDDGIVPVPNYYLVNPETGHGQVGWFVEGTVVVGTAAGRWFDSIREGLTVILGGDPDFSNSHIRNPIYTGAVAVWLRDEAYSMKELWSYCTRSSQSAPVRLREPSVMAQFSRSFTLFDAVRLEAYRVHDNFATRDALYKYLLDYASTKNDELFEEPLPDSEVKSTARSVSKYVKRWFVSKSEWAARQAAKRWDKTADDRNELKAVLMTMHEAGMSYAEIAENITASGMKVMSKAAVTKAIQRIKKDTPVLGVEDEVDNVELVDTLDVFAQHEGDSDENHTNKQLQHEGYGTWMEAQRKQQVQHKAKRNSNVPVEL